jgi:hypothetical protein
MRRNAVKKKGPGARFEPHGSPRPQRNCNWPGPSEQRENEAQLESGFHTMFLMPSSGNEKKKHERRPPEIAGAAGFSQRRTKKESKRPAFVQWGMKWRA